MNIGTKKILSRPKHPPIQKLVTIELTSGCGRQWHVEDFLREGWHIVQLAPIPGDGARTNGCGDEASRTEEVTSWLAVLLEKPARF